MILLITNKSDVHPNLVIEHLNKMEYPIFRLNTESLLTDYAFSWWHNGKETDFKIRNIRNGKEVYGHDINSVWERRPASPSELPHASTIEINEHILDEASGFLCMLRYFVGNRYCIGHALYDRHSDSKLWQSQVACKLGMTVPKTIISNRKEVIVNFAQEHDTLIIKPFSSDSVFFEDDTTERVFYARKITLEQIEEAPSESFSQTVSFVQEYIHKKYELRITVIHNHIFACKIDSQKQSDDNGKIDWRQGYAYDLKHEIVEIPKNIKSFCISYLKKMHLNFGCFDFIVTPEDKYVFLECNPNGQWRWIEILTNAPMSKAMAEVLVAADKKQIISNNACF